MTKVILFNGPPRSGKDVAASIIKASSPSHVVLEKFAWPLKTAVPIAYGITHDEWRHNYDTSENKDTPTEAFFGKTPREVQIALSETFFKPLHGADIFGRLLARRLSQFARLAIPTLVVSDSGFRDEVLPILDVFGADRVFLFRLHRPGCDFGQDSRSYIHLADLGVRELDIYNTSTLEDFSQAVISSYQTAISPMEILGKDDKNPGHQETEGEYNARLATMLMMQQEWLDKAKQK